MVHDRPIWQPSCYLCFWCDMKSLRFLVSLPTNVSDYQIEQALAAEEAARRLEVNVEVVHAGNDALTQNQQVLGAIQARPDSRPHAIVLEPVGETGMPKVARAAASAGIGWVVLNRNFDDMAELCSSFSVPIFAVGPDQRRIGHIQAWQFAALLPTGGTVLYVQGPVGSSAAKVRAAGMCESKPVNLETKMLRAQWTRESAHHVVSSWLRLSAAREMRIDLVGAQDDAMALGARDAFQERLELGQWFDLPFVGCGGLPRTGRAWVSGGLLAATVVIPPTTNLALEVLVQAIRTGSPPPRRIVTTLMSFPAVEDLARGRLQCSTPG